MTPPARIVLHQPEIPNNTGNIGRTCVALGMPLDLIHPLSFDIDEKACRRAGLDYWPRLDLTEHKGWQPYLDTSPGARRWLFTTKASRSVFDADIRPGDHLVFGGETRGLPDDILEAHAGELVTLPMAAGERSLNLATAVCAAAYEAVRQQLAAGDLTLDGGGRIVFG